MHLSIVQTAYYYNEVTFSPNTAYAFGECLLKGKEVDNIAFIIFVDFRTAPLLFNVFTLSEKKGIVH